MNDAGTMLRRRGARLLAWVIATTLLVACARTIDWSKAMETLATARPSWILVALAANAGILVCMAAFWRTLRPVEEGPTTFQRMFEIAATATAVMNTVPFGAGHASLVLLLIRYGNTSRRGALSVLALDQLGEGIVKVTLFLLVAMLVPLPGWMRAGVATTTVVVVLLLAGLMVGSRWARELRVLRRWRQSGAALLYVAGTKVCEGLALAAVQHAFGVELSVATLLVLAAVVLGTMLPLAPANLGTYEASAFLAYRYLGLAPEQALSLAIAQHVCFIVPSVGIGYLVISAQTVVRSALSSSRA